MSLPTGGWGRDLSHTWIQPLPAHRPGMSLSSAARGFKCASLHAHQFLDVDQPAQDSIARPTLFWALQEHK